MSEYCHKIRASEKLPGKDAIFVHGDKAFNNMEIAQTRGVAIDNATWSEISELCERYGIDPVEKENIKKGECQ